MGARRCGQCGKRLVFDVLEFCNGECAEAYARIRAALEAGCIRERHRRGEGPRSKVVRGAQGFKARLRGGEDG